MNYKQLKYHASDCQLSADRMAYELIKESETLSLLCPLQSICDFNLYWVYSISPVLVRDVTLEFLNEHKDLFKRKITIRELLYYDFLIHNYEPKTFNEFKKLAL